MFHNSVPRPGRDFSEDTSKALRQRLGRPWSLALGSVLAVALLWVGTEWAVAAIQNAACREALNRTRLIAAAAEQSLRRTLAVSSDVATIAQEWQDDRALGLPATDNWARIKKIAHEPSFGVGNIWITDPTGLVEEATNVRGLGLVLPNGDYSRPLQNGAPGPVFRFSDATGRTLLVASYRLHSLNGAFGGMVSVQLDPWTIYRHLVTMPGEATVLAAIFQHDSGKLLALTPVLPERFTEIETDLALLLGTTDKPPDGFADTGAAVAGRGRVVAWSTITEYGLVAYVETSERAAIAAVAGTVASLRLAALVVTLCIGFTAWMTVLAGRKSVAQAERNRAVAVYAELLRLLDGAPVVLFQLSVLPDGTLRNRLTAGDTQAVLGWPAGGLQSAPEIAAVLGAARLADEVARLQQQGAGDTELSFHRQDGGAGWARLAGRITARSADGSAELVLALADATREVELRSEAEIAERFAMLAELGGSLGHELIQPLFAARMAAELGTALLDGAAPDPTRLRAQFAATVGQVQRALGIVEGLRALSRADAPMAASSTDLVVALADATTVVKPKLSQAGIVLEVEMPDLPEVTGSRIGLAQVLSNLLNNAADAVASRQTGPRWIHVAGWCRDSEITLEVADSGGGIPDALLPRVFAPFFTTKVSGTGLGLAVCQRNMQAAGGEIRVRNGDAGAVFTLTFRRAIHPRPARRLGRKAHHPATNAGKDWAGIPPSLPECRATAPKASAAFFKPPQQTAQGHPEP